MDVGQGDGAVLISPLGEVVLFDAGVRNFRDRPISYLQQLGAQFLSIQGQRRWSPLGGGGSKIKSNLSAFGTATIADESSL